MKHLFVILLCLLFAFPVSAKPTSGLSQKQIKKMKNEVANTPINTFRFINNALVCISDTPDEYACFQIGNLKIGQKYKPLEKSWKDVPQKNDVIASVHPIISDEKHSAYWVIGHKRGIITSIQLTGDYPLEELTFSTIKLTDSKEKVKNILGPRYLESKVESINGQMWDYAPFQITIEFKNEVVYSIRITE